MARKRFLEVASVSLFIAGAPCPRAAAQATVQAAVAAAGAPGGAGVAAASAASAVPTGASQAPLSALLGPGAPAFDAVSREIIKQVRSERWSDSATALRDLGRSRLGLVRGTGRDANAIILLAVASSGQLDPKVWPSLKRGLPEEALRELESFRERLFAEIEAKQLRKELAEIERNASYEEARARRALARAGQYAKILLAGLGTPEGPLAIDSAGDGRTSRPRTGRALEPFEPRAASEPRREEPPSPSADGPRADRPIGKSGSGGALPLTSRDKAMLTGIFAGFAAGAALVLAGMPAMILGLPVSTVLAVLAGALWSWPAFKPALERYGRRQGAVLGVLNAVVVTAALVTVATLLPNIGIPIIGIMVGKTLGIWAHRWRERFREQSVFALVGHDAAESATSLGALAVSALMGLASLVLPWSALAAGVAAGIAAPVLSFLMFRGRMDTGRTVAGVMFSSFVAGGLAAALNGYYPVGALAWALSGLAYWWISLQTPLNSPLRRWEDLRLGQVLGRIVPRAGR